jgi:hypothetical protein
VDNPLTLTFAESSELPRCCLWEGVCWSVAHWTIRPACVPFHPPARATSKLSHISTQYSSRLPYSFSPGGNRNSFATACTSYIAPPEVGVWDESADHLTSISSSQAPGLRILHIHKITEKRAYILYAARHPIIHAAGKQSADTRRALAE